MAVGQSELMQSVSGHSVGTLNLRKPGQRLLGAWFIGMVTFSITAIEKLSSGNWIMLPISCLRPLAPRFKLRRYTVSHTPRNTLGWWFIKNIKCNLYWKHHFMCSLNRNLWCNCYRLCRLLGKKDSDCSQSLLRKRWAAETAMLLLGLCPYPQRKAIHDVAANQFSDSVKGSFLFFSFSFYSKCMAWGKIMSLGSERPWFKS